VIETTATSDGPSLDVLEAGGEAIVTRLDVIDEGALPHRRSRSRLRLSDEPEQTTPVDGVTD